MSAADPVRRATALRTSNDPRNAFPGGIDDGAIDEESDDLLTDSDEEADDTEDARFFSTKDPALLEIQAKRLAEMKLAAEKARAERANTAANASYVAVDEADIPKHLRDGPTRVVLHFPSEGSDASARVDEVFDALAPAFPQTRFARVRCPSGTSPTISALTGGATAYPPAVLCFSKRKLGPWTVGYEAFGGVERFDEERVVKWLARVAEALPGHPDAPRRANRVGGGFALGVSGTRGGYDDRESDEEEGLRRRRDHEGPSGDHRCQVWWLCLPVAHRDRAMQRAALPRRLHRLRLERLVRLLLVVRRWHHAPDTQRDPGGSEHGECLPRSGPGGRLPHARLPR